MKKGEYEILEFENEKQFRDWLQVNFDTSLGIFVRLYKKNSGVKSVTYAECVDEALCFGWIDSQSNSLDEISYIQKFTPRRAKSIWSKINIAKVEKLISEGRMRAAGMAEIERAKADGRWAQAYDSPSTMEVPQDFLELLEKHKKAKEFFETLNKTNKFAIGFKLQTAKKPETRERRKQAILEMLNKGEKLY
jgi:uncharacterized protein YdeI (YjbR/CyaY-like superfamily)